MTAADRYRRTASECIAITTFFVDPRRRATILALAEAWTRLAEQAERNEQALRQAPADTPSPSGGTLPAKPGGVPAD